MIWSTKSLKNFALKSLNWKLKKVQWNWRPLISLNSKSCHDWRSLVTFKSSYWILSGWISWQITHNWSSMVYIELMKFHLIFSITVQASALLVLRGESICPPFSPQLSFIFYPPILLNSSLGILGSFHHTSEHLIKVNRSIPTPKLPSSPVCLV